MITEDWAVLDSQAEVISLRVLDLLDESAGRHTPNMTKEERFQYLLKEVARYLLVEIKG